MKVEPLMLGLVAMILLAPAVAQPAAPGEGVYGEALLRQYVQPEYPAAARQGKLEGRVMVEFVVEADGRVTRASVKKSTDARFNASALAAVERWVFAPALADNKPVASGMQAAVVFKLAQLPQKKAPAEPTRESMPVQAPVTPPKLVVAPNPDYPAELEERLLPGRVVLEFTVEPDGTASAPKILWSPHPAFVGEALRTLKDYRFEPGHQGPLLLPMPATQGEMEFRNLGSSRTEILAANQITVVEPERYREPPRPAVLPRPVYPRERLLAGETGSATVEFTVTDRGATTGIVLKETSQPEFGAALVAAVEAWRFDAALVDNQRAEAKLVVADKFVPPPAGEEKRLLVALQPGGAGVGGAAGLDQRPRPVWLVQPVYPQVLREGKPAGRAVIEFIIDRAGRARLPRVESASRDEFGWAAATAVSQWVFAPPSRGGQPTEVKVSVPVEFVAPAG